MLDCLSNFGDISGLRVNELKSNMFIASLYGCDLEVIKVVANFLLGVMPFRYLWVPLVAKRLNVITILLSLIKSQIILIRRSVLCCCMQVGWS